MVDAAFAALPSERLAEIGFTLAPEHQGHGYATEAVRRLLHYLLIERGKHRASATCDDRNTRSVAAHQEATSVRRSSRVKVSGGSGRAAEQVSGRGSPLRAARSATRRRNPPGPRKRTIRTAPSSRSWSSRARSSRPRRPVSLRANHSAACTTGGSLQRPR